MKEHSWGRVLRAGTWGVLVGGMAGFVLGMLVAPEEGRKLRRRLVYQLDNLSGQVNTLVDQVISPEAESEARRQGHAVVADAEVQAQRIREDMETLLGQMRRRTQPTSSSSTS